MVLVCRLHELHPVNADNVFSSLILWLELGNILLLFETVKAATPLNKEVKVFFDLIFDGLDDLCPHLSRIVWDIRLELQGIFVDTLDAGLIKLKL